VWVLEPLEFVFPPDESFKHFELKWVNFERMAARPVEHEALRARLREIAGLAFQSLGCSGYGRCDIRSNADGELYLLEINPNCAVFYPEGSFGSADLILAADAEGHRGFLRHQIDLALRRQASRRRVWDLEYTRESGFGMFANRAMAAGEMVERYEERAATLVSREHVERRWSGYRRRWFDQYAWPVTTDTHVIWSADPEEWRPINHSCDPNTWLDGLDVVARRDIGPGEQLTIDYATFCGPAMESFECKCGAAECRRLVTGMDHLLPAVRERYGDHVSDFIRTRRRQNSGAPVYR
jgi:D-alanine-D-alanine ligase